MKVLCATMALLCAIMFAYAQQPKTYRNADFWFARLEYRMDHDDTLIKGWYTDYPEMEQHAVEFINRLTNIRANYTTVKPGSGAIFLFPFVYVAEPEQMILNDAEVGNLRTWFKRGGFMVLDDFHGDEEYRTAITLVRRILPADKHRFAELHTDHPLFHVFFDIRKIEQVVNDSLISCRDAGCEQWENGPTGKDPHIYAIFDEHDNIEVLMFYNTDLGDGLEFADDPTYPREQAAYATRMIINTVIWSTTH